MRPLLIRITRPSTRLHGYMRGYWGVTVYRPTRPDFDPGLLWHGGLIDAFGAIDLRAASELLRARRELYATADGSRLVG